jgi:hypothetical protein
MTILFSIFFISYDRSKCLKVTSTLKTISFKHSDQIFHLCETGRSTNA